MIESGCFGHVCPPWFAPQFPMVSSTNVDAVAANNVALQHYGQKVVYGHVMTNIGKRILIQITFDVMNVRKPFLSTSALKHSGVTIIFNHDYDRIIFRNETVNLISHDCHSYLHVILTNGILPCKALVMTGRMRQMTWMRKPTATMAPRDMRLEKLEKLQLVIDEHSTMRIKMDSLTFSGETETARSLRTPERPTDWSPFCVASRGRSSLHRRVVVNKTADTLPKFQTDYMFIRTVAESKT